MAKVKDLKKDVNYITSEIVLECFTYDMLFPDKDKEELSKIITDAVKFREDALTSINAAKRDKDEPAKVAFQKINKQIDEKIAELVERLAKLEK